MEEILIGYDAREMSKTFADVWDEDRHKTFLIREDLVKPLSADESVWPSIFRLAQIQRPETIGYRANLWADLDALEAYLEDKLTDSDSEYAEIAVSQFFDNLMLDELGWHDFINPHSIAEDWVFLGYDIAEDVLLSGLLNMGYRPEEKLYAKQEFLPHLNHFHLFTDYEIAKKFAVWNQSRDKGHGPYFVTGIYWINKHNENLASILSEKSP